MLVGSRECHSRVRALFDDRDERIRWAENRTLSEQPREQAARRGHQCASADHAVERRGIDSRDVCATARVHSHVGACGRRDGRALGGRHVGCARCDHRRHRWHVSRFQHDSRWAGQDHEPARHLRGRLSGARAHDRHGDDGRRRRIDCIHRRGRCVSRGSALGGRRPGARVLRPRRHRADRHGCAGGAGTPRPGPVPRRRREDRSGACASSHRGEDCTPARHERCESTFITSGRFWRSRKRSSSAWRPTACT